MASLFNTKISDTYPGLIKTLDNAAISASLKELTDGSGNQSGLFINTAGDFKASGILEFGSLKDTGENITITKFVDEADGIANNDNDTTIPTSAAVVDYVASKITLEDLDFSGDTGNGSVDLDSQTFAIVGTSNEIETSASGQQLQIGLPSSISVNLVGNVTGNVTGDLTGNVTATSVLADGVTATTQSYGDNSTKVATTAYVDAQVTAEDLDFVGNTGTGSVDLDSNIFNVVGTTNEITTSATGQTLQIQLNSSGVILPNNSTATTQTDGDNSTKIATTAYVDTAIQGHDTLAEVLVGGNTTGGTNISVSTGDNITFADSSKVQFGASVGLQISHDGTDSYIQNATGNLRIFQNANDKDITFYNDNGSGGTTAYFYLDGSDVNTRFVKDAKFSDSVKAVFGGSNDLQIYHDGSHSYIKDTGTGDLKLQASNDIFLLDGSGNVMLEASEGGSVDLFHNGSKKLETTSTGVTVTGSISTNSGSGTAILGSHLDLGDNQKARFGASQDLQIYHDGSNSFISDVGIGSLFITGANNIYLQNGSNETYLDTTTNGAVRLFHDNSLKLYTTSTGVSVTGGITTTEEIKIIDSSATGSPKLSFYQTTNERAYIQYADTGEKLIIDSDADLVFNTNNTERLTIDSTGAASFSESLTIAGDLTVNGTTTTVNTQTLAVEDPLISLAKDNSANSVDIGFYGRYNDGTNRYLGLYADASDSNTFNLFKGTETEPTTTVDTSATGYDTATLRVQNLIGSSSGNDRIKVQGSNGTLQWGSSANFGQLSWDTGYALVRGMASKGLKLQINSSTTVLTLDTSQNATFAGDVYVTGTTNSNVFISRDNMYLDAGQFYIGADDSVTDDSFRQRTASGSYFIESRKSGTWTNRLQINSAGTLIAGQGATFAGDVTLSAAGSTGEIIRTTDNTEPYLALQRNSGNNGVGVLRLLDGGDLTFDTGATGAGQATRLTIDGSTGNATFAGNVTLSSGFANLPAGTEADPSLIFAGDDDTGLWHPASNTLAFSTFGTERMRIDSSGKVGIGSDSPFEDLEIIRDNSSPTLIVKASGQTSSTTPTASLFLSPGSFSSNATAPRIIGYRTADFSSAAARSAGLKFGVAQNNVAKDAMWLTEAGNLGIGTDDVYGDLHLYGGQQDIVLTNTSADGVAGLTISRIIGQARGYGNNGAAMQSIDFVTNSSAWYKGDIVFKTNNTDGTDPAVAASERMRIESDGDVSLNGGDFYVNGGTSYNDKSNIYLSNGRTLIQSDIVNATANGDTSLNFQTRSAGAEASAMFINEFRNIGIGTTSISSTDGRLKLSAPSGVSNPAGISLYGNNSNAYGGSNVVRSKIQSVTDGTAFGAIMKFYTNDTSNVEQQRMIINSDGNVGINNLVASAKLQIHNTNAGAGAVAAFLVNASTSLNTETKLAFAAHTNDDIATNRYSYISTVNTSGSNGQDMKFATNETGASAVERMRITSGGNVAIGGTLGADSQFRVELKPAGTILAGLRIGYNGTSNNYFDGDNQYFRNGLGNTNRMVITSVGRVLINNSNTSNDAICHIGGNASNYALYLYADVLYAGNYRYQRFRSGTNIAGGIEGINQTSVVYSTSSDYRMKKNIKPLENGLERLSKLKPVKFDWKLNDKSTEGFIAHEVQEIFPDAISGEKDGKEMQGMDYGRITPLLVAAIQELKAEVDKLKQECKCK